MLYVHMFQAGVHTFHEILKRVCEMNYDPLLKERDVCVEQPVGLDDL